MSIIVIEIVVAVIIAAVIGAGAGYTARKRTAEAQIGSAEEEAKRIVADAEEKGETKKKEALLEAKEEIHQMRQSLDKDTKERKNELAARPRVNIGAVDKEILEQLINEWVHGGKLFLFFSSESDYERFRAAVADRLAAEGKIDEIIGRKNEFLGII